MPSIIIIATFKYICVCSIYLSYCSVPFAGSVFGQRPGFRAGPGFPTSQRHLPARTTDPPEADEDYKPTKQCPQPDGFFPDDEQCDKYYQCQ